MKKLIIVKVLFISASYCWCQDTGGVKNIDSIIIANEKNSKPIHNQKKSSNGNNSRVHRTDSSFILTGKTSGMPKGVLKLSYVNDAGINITDNCEVKNNKFQFRGTIKEPTMAFLYKDGVIDADDHNSTSFFIEPATIKIQLTFNHFKKAIITGSKTADENKILEKLIEPITKEMEPLQKEYEKANYSYLAAVKEKKDEKLTEELKNNVNYVSEKFGPYNDRIAKIQYVFFTNYPQSYVTAYKLAFHVRRLTPDSLQFFYDKLGGTVQQSGFGRYVAKKLEQLRSGWQGSIGKNFTAKELGGDTLSLFDFRGKYVLLDFWASWCIPCRKGNPHLKILYDRYRNEGIEFIGIADDDHKEDQWKKAISMDSIGIWKHVRRGIKYENGQMDQSADINSKYGINTLPTKILINREGIIIGRYSEDDGPLDEMLKKIFGY